MLECIDHADDFIDTAPQWQVVDDHMPYDTALVDKEKPAVGYGSTALEQEFILFTRQILSAEDAVILGDGFRRIGDYRILHPFDTASVSGLAEPGQVGILRINRTAYYLYAAGLEFAQFLLERMQLRRAHERKIHRVEKQNHILFPLVLAEGEVLYNLISVHYRRRTDGRRLFSYQRFHISLCFNE